MSHHELNQQLGDQLPTAEQQTGQEIREHLLSRLIVGQTIAVAALSLMTGTGGLLMPGSGLLALLPLGLVAMFVGMLSYWVLKRGWFLAAGYLFLLGTSAAITVNVFIRGYEDASGIYYLWPILAAVTILETRGGMLVTFVSAGCYLALVVAQELGYQYPMLPYDAQEEALLTVGSRVLMFFLLAFLAWLSARGLNQALQVARQAAQRWRDLSESLEQRVTDRTRDLEQRSAYLEASVEVGRAASSILEGDELIHQVVDLIRERFGLYYVGLFQVDGGWAVLRAGTGQAGRALLERGHRIRVGEGMVGWSITHGRPRVALEVGEDAVRLATAELPETRSEAALPLRSRGQIIGALSVQHTRAGAFDPDTLAVLQIMADQVAVALDNARLFAESQAALEAQRRAYGELGRQGWQELFRAGQDLELRYDPDGILQSREAEGPGGATGTCPTLAVPLKLREQAIGVLNAYKPAGTGEWTDEEMALLQTLVDQLGLALESARLYQDTQRRAARERLLAGVADRMRQSLDLDMVLQAAVREMRQALDLHDVTIRLEGIEGSTPSGAAGNVDAQARASAAPGSDDGGGRS
jgi:GAF domain-containing protein